MKRILILIPVLLVTAAVGFLLYRGPSFAEEVSVTDGGSSKGQNIPQDIFYTKSVKSVVFSHQTHAVDLGFKCDTCHTSVFQMKAHYVETQPDFNMEGLADGKYCGSCHSSSNKAAFSSDTQCARCHRGVKGLERAAEANYIQES